LVPLSLSSEEKQLPKGVVADYRQPALFMKRFEKARLPAAPTQARNKSGFSRCGESFASIPGRWQGR
jgi:hypothetical protein